MLLLPLLLLVLVGSLVDVVAGDVCFVRRLRACSRRLATLSSGIVIAVDASEERHYDVRLGPLADERRRHDVFVVAAAHRARRCVPRARAADDAAGRVVVANGGAVAVESVWSMQRTACSGADIEQLEVQWAPLGRSYLLVRRCAHAHDAASTSANGLACVDDACALPSAADEEADAAVAPPPAADAAGHAPGATQAAAACVDALVVHARNCSGLAFSVLDETAAANEALLCPRALALDDDDDGQE